MTVVHERDRFLEAIGAATPKAVSDMASFEQAVDAICEAIADPALQPQARYGLYRGLAKAAREKQADWLYSRLFEAAGEAMLAGPLAVSLYFAEKMRQSRRAPLSATAALLLVVENDNHLEVRKDALKALGKIGCCLIEAGEGEDLFSEVRKKDPLSIVTLNSDNARRAEITIRTLLESIVRDPENLHHPHLRAAALCGLGEMSGIYSKESNAYAPQALEMAKDILAEERAGSMLYEVASGLVFLYEKLHKSSLFGRAP